MQLYFLWARRHRILSLLPAGEPVWWREPVNQNVYPPQMGYCGAPDQNWTWGRGRG